MITNNPSQLSKIFANLQVDTLACHTGFSLRRARKITVEYLLASFFQMIADGRFSLRQWACNITALNGSLISFQAIAKKLDFRQEPFFHALFQKALLTRLQQKLNFQIHDILKPFRRVMIEDSTCFKLPTALFDFFPGARLPHGRMAGGRLQLRIDLKNHHYEAIALRSYCQNDQTFADDILNSLQKDELIIRDLGYWSIPVFKQIIHRGAYFLSRLNLGVNVLCPVTQQDINMVAFLRKQERQGIRQIDMPVLLSEKYRIPVRLVAIKLTNDQAQKRRRMAKTQRHKNEPISEYANYLMSWNLFITNVKNETWDIPSVYYAYTLRWHIEIIFKCWKSKFNFNTFFKHCN
ncbi:MAG TPA: IS4 family transposase, partial [Chitinophagaceae bacterium]